MHRILILLAKVYTILLVYTVNDVGEYQQYDFSKSEIGELRLLNLSNDAVIHNTKNVSFWTLEQAMNILTQLEFFFIRHSPNVTILHLQVLCESDLYEIVVNLHKVKRNHIQNGISMSHFHTDFEIVEKMKEFCQHFRLLMKMHEENLSLIKNDLYKNLLEEFLSKENEIYFSVAQRFASYVEDSQEKFNLDFVLYWEGDLLQQKEKIGIQSIRRRLESVQKYLYRKSDKTSSEIEFANLVARCKENETLLKILGLEILKVFPYV